VWDYYRRLQPNIQTVVKARQLVYNYVMVTKYSHNGLTWIDVEAPTGDEVKALMSEYHIHPLVGEEFMIPSEKTKVDVYDHYLYLTLHFPTREGSKETSHEIDFLVGTNYCITLHYEPIEALTTFSKVFETHSILNKKEEGEHGGFLFYFIVKKLYAAVGYDLDGIKSRLQHVEREIFKGNERDQVFELSTQSRKLLDCKQTLFGHKEVLESFKEASAKFFGPAFLPHADLLVDEHVRTYTTILASKEFLHDLRDTNDSLLSAKQSEIMKLFTVSAFVTFPLVLTVEILSIPSVANPLHGNPHDFWIIIGVVVVAAYGMFNYFKSKKWL